MAFKKLKINHKTGKQKAGVMIEKMNDKVYQEIFNTLVPLLPKVWTKLVVYLECGKGSYSFSVYYNEGEK